MVTRELNEPEKKMSDETNWFEWGYQVPDGEAVWQIDHGTDGSWTPAIPELGIGHVDIYDGREFKDIRSALDAAGLTAAYVVRRQVSQTRGAPERVDEAGEPV